MPQATSRSRATSSLTRGSRGLDLAFEEELGVDVSPDLTSILTPPKRVRAEVAVRRDGGDFSINLLGLSVADRNITRMWIQSTRALLDRIEAVLDDQARETGAAE